MATLRKTKKSAYWVAVFRDRTGKQFNRSTKIFHSGGTAREMAENRKKALKVAEGYEHLVRGETLRESEIKRISLELASLGRDQKVDLMSLRRFLEDWLKRIDNSPNTLARYRQVCRDFISFLGQKADQPVDLIQPIDVQNFVSSLSQRNLASKTISNQLKILRIPFAEGVRLQVLSADPAIAVKAPKVASVTREAFTVDELKAILKATEGFENGHEWKTVILLGYYGAMRLGDASTLTWDSIDLTALKLAFVPEKTKKQVEIPIHDALHKHLVGLPRGDDPKATLSPTLAKIPSNRRYYLSRQFNRICDKAGIVNEMRGSSVRKVSTKSFHSLRHTLTSHLAGKNVSAELRMKLTAHEDERVHAGYTHLQFDQMRSALNQLDDLNE